MDNFKACKRLILVYLVDFLLDFFNDPWHQSGVSFNIVEFKTFAFELFDLRWIKVNIFSRKCKIVASIDFY